MMADDFASLYSFYLQPSCQSFSEVSYSIYTTPRRMILSFAPRYDNVTSVPLFVLHPTGKIINFNMILKTVSLTPDQGSLGSNPSWAE
jgi:hypothetical protein